MHADSCISTRQSIGSSWYRPYPTHYIIAHESSNFDRYERTYAVLNTCSHVLEKEELKALPGRCPRSLFPHWKLFEGASELLRTSRKIRFMEVWRRNSGLTTPKLREHGGA